MKKDPFIFALANPVPEIYPIEAKEAGAYIVCTGRSDFKNQVNNCLAFPGIFRGVLDIQAKKVTMELKVAAASAIANIVSPLDLNPDHVIPNALDSRVTNLFLCFIQAGVSFYFLNFTEYFIFKHFLGCNYS